MFNLFLETKAAAQIREWCRLNGQTDEYRDDLIQSAYNNAVNCEMYDNDVGGFDGYLVGRALQDGSHNRIDIDTAFIWDGTPEGRDFWSHVNQMRVPVPPIPV